jgi:hypothetical protein
MLMEAIADQILATDKDFPEVSIIMPRLNEAHTLAACIGKARRALNEQKIAGEKSSLPTMGAPMEVTLSRRNSAPAWSTYEREDTAAPSWV